MGRPCTICNHDQRSAIDAALVDNVAFRPLGTEYAVSPKALARHKADHLPVSLAKAADAADAARADDLLGEALTMQRRLLRIADKAETAEHWPSAIAALSAIRGYLELRAKLRGEMADGSTTNIIVNAEYVQTRTRLLTALAPYPDARLAAAEALGEVAGGG